MFPLSDVTIPMGSLHLLPLIFHATTEFSARKNKSQLFYNFYNTNKQSIELLDFIF